MTLKYHRGMSLADFQDMVAEHQREEQQTGRRAPVAVMRCDHPFEQDGLSITAHSADGGLEVRACYQCPACNTKWAIKRLLPFRKKAQT